MKFIQPTENVRFNEPIGFVLLIAGIALGLGLVSHYPFDPSWNVAAPLAEPQNLLGYPGAYLSDLALQWLGWSAFLLPVYVLILGWRWVRSAPLHLPLGRLVGAALLVLIVAGALAVRPSMVLWSGTVSSGGLLGALLAESLVRYLNEAGAFLTFLAGGILSLYLLTSFSLGPGSDWVADRSSYLGFGTGRLAVWRGRLAERMRGWLGRRAERRRFEEAADFDGSEQRKPPLVQGRPRVRRDVVESDEGAESTALPPIVPYEAASVHAPPEEDDDLPFELTSESKPARPRPPRTYHLPSTLLLRQAPERGAYNPDELHQLARQICAKFEEFGVHGSVTQINPGPVVTTFEFKPDAGIKYSRITNLSEDLCLALECESVMVERIPGKSTIGIEVPNRRRETIVLREMIESPEFTESASFITMVLGKDINGRNRVANLASMPHLLIAGSTGAGKSVLVNSIIMSILFKAAPDQVRFVMVDPKTVELGLYVDIPHLLTPVITDMKKASNALKNATREMERRLKLLAEFGVRNIDQFNEKVDKLDPDVYEGGELPGKLPYIVIIIDELADLMMLEGRQIEESITRLAQMARAVGIHLILATQRPSVDVITGLIKANIPARISFRLATRVDSRTILDAMGAESLLGRGDMLFLPPASGRMTRLHGPLVTEEEIQAVVRFWKEQGKPDYETAFLAPPDDEAGEDGAEDEGFDDPAYEDAVRVVLEMGKASTSTLQRRLRLGYGRAARILDAMERDGIIGPPDGSRPREVLKRPDWLVEVGR